MKYYGNSFHSMEELCYLNKITLLQIFMKSMHYIGHIMDISWDSKISVTARCH